jgi:hypothetical protein
MSDPPVVRPPSDLEQFREASRTIGRYGKLLTIGPYLTVLGLTPLFVWRFGHSIQPFGLWLRTKTHNETLVGLVGGLVFGGIFVVVVLILLLPELWLDRRFGMRCLGCRKSLTFGGRRDRVLRTGHCFFCQYKVFDIAPTR